VEMVAVDDQPFSVVNNKSFCQLISAALLRYNFLNKSYLRKTGILDLWCCYQKVCENFAEWRAVYQHDHDDVHVFQVTHELDSTFDWQSHMAVNI